jgi:hypothetical protein
VLNLVSRTRTLSVMNMSHTVKSALDSKLRLPMRSTVLSLVSMLMGCSVPPPVIVEKPVIVDREVRVSMPPDLIQPCIGRPEDLSAVSATNGVLLVNRREWMEYAACLESKLDRVRELQP